MRGWLFTKTHVAPQLTEISFEDIGKGLESLKEGKVKGRLVAVMDEASK